MYYTYILYSEKLDKHYVGSTNDLLRRLADHNRGKTAYARLGMPWVLRYHEQFNSKSEAVRREMEIKGKKSRKYIENLIATNPAGSSIPPEAGGSLVLPPE
jgi:putative endonuclease